MTLFRKNILYKQDDFDYAMFLKACERDTDRLGALLEVVHRELGITGLQETTMKMLQIKCGVQYIVQKELSDELSHVDFDNSNFEDIAWPATSIEFFFEDPELPSIVVAHSRYDGFVFELAKALYGPEYAATLPGHARFREPALGAVCDNVGALTSCTVVHNFETWNEALESKGDLVPTLDPEATHKQSKQEAAELHHMLNLSMKVLAYSNIPHFRPEPVTRKQMGRGPKPGVCGRPTRPSFRTVYLLYD